MGAHSGLKKKNTGQGQPFNPTWLLVYHVCLWCF